VGEAVKDCHTHLAAKRRAMPLSAAARNASTSSAGGDDLPIFPLFGLRNTEGGESISYGAVQGIACLRQALVSSAPLLSGGDRREARRCGKRSERETDDVPAPAMSPSRLLHLGTTVVVAVAAAAAILFCFVALARSLLYSASRGPPCGR